MAKGRPCPGGHGSHFARGTQVLGGWMGSMKEGRKNKEEAGGRTRIYTPCGQGGRAGPGGRGPGVHSRWPAVSTFQGSSPHVP